CRGASEVTPRLRNWGALTPIAGRCEPNPTMRIDLDAIRQAAERTSPHLHRTPVFSSHGLGERAGVRLRLKCESFQKTGSFKPRGALNIVLSLPRERLARARVPASPGNHAQAVVAGAQVVHTPRTVGLTAGAPRPTCAGLRRACSTTRT